MGTAIVKLGSSGPPRDVYQGRWEHYDGLRLLLVRSKKPDGGTAFVAWSLEDAIPWIKRDEVWGKCVGQARSLLVQVDSGQPFDAKIIEDVAFYALMISAPEWNQWKTRAVMLLTGQHRGKVAIPDDVSGDHVLQQLQALTETRIAVLRAANEAAEAKQLAIDASRRADSAYNLAETSLELQVTRNGRLRAIPELSRRGWKFDEKNFGTVGGELTRISLKQLGDDPRLPENQCQWRNDTVHTYIEQAFTIWEKECSHKYPRRSETIPTGSA